MLATDTPLAPRMTDTRSRLSLLPALIGDWFAPLAPRGGWSDAGIDRRLLRSATRGAVPAALRHWHRLAGDRADLTAQDPPVPLDALEEGGDGFVTFWTESQAVVSWAYRAEDAGLADPPVWSRWSGSGPGRWEPEHASLSGFLVRVVLQNVVVASTRASLACVPASRAGGASIIGSTSSLGLPPSDWPTGGAEFRCASGTLVLLCRDEAFVACRSRAAQEAWAGAFPGAEWFHPAAGEAG